NRDLAEQGLQQVSFGLRSGVLQFDGDLSVNGGIDAADEEAGDTGDSTDIAAARGEFLQAGDVGFCNLLISALREQKGYVSVDALTNELVDRGNTLGSGRDLDHQIGTVDPVPKAASLFECPLSVAGERGRDLEAHISIALLCRRVDEVHDVAGGLDVLNGKLLE